VTGRGSSRDPSLRQQQIVDAVAEHESVAAAASALGLSRITVETTVARYHTAVCGHRIEELEAELALLRERDAARLTAARLETVVGRLERLATPVSHRRLADGGTHVTEQRRRLKGRDALAPNASGLGGPPRYRAGMATHLSGSGDLSFRRAGTAQRDRRVEGREATSPAARAGPIDD
jgi:hypothetical protein